MPLRPSAVLRSGINRIRTAAGADPIDEDAGLAAQIGQVGQILVIFVLMLTVLIGLMGLAIDTTYAWREALRVQRAADAASLAGVVYMPGDFPTATTTADTEAAMNGYPVAANTIAVTRAANPDELDVAITAHSPTFFSRIFGIDSFTVSRSSKAVYVLPVPLGSPLAYYGVGCFVLSSGGTPPCNSGGTGLSGVTDGSTTFSSLGGWGSIITRGGNQQNGDAFAPANNAGGSGFSSGANASYNPAGYYYTASLPSGGTIKVFDPGFCAMGGNPSGAGNYGAGDHWIGGAQSPVSTYYTVWNTNGQPLLPARWTQVYASGTLFENELGGDTANGGPNTGHACDAYHDKWWLIPTGSLAAGNYEVEVSTTSPTDPSINASTNAENMFAIEAVGGGSPQVSGLSNMCVYNNLAGGAQQFYLAKVDRQTGAGKTVQIRLFDIGDVSGNGTLQILSPDGPGATQQLATFSYSADSNWNVSAASAGNGGTDAQSASGRTSIAVARTGSTSSFNNTWITISIALPSTYGSGGLWQGGWWQIIYNVGSANDTTTWAVNVVGNPVHLI